MNLLQSVIFGYVFTAAILMDLCVFQTISASSLQTGGNFLGLDSVPDTLVDGSVVCVRYRCSRPCQLAVEVLVSTFRKTNLVIFRRKWISSSTPRGYKTHRVRLRLPPSILYQRGIFNWRVLDVQNMTVSARLAHLDHSSETGTYYDSRWRVDKVLLVKPLSERPSKPPTECPTWSAQLMWQISRNGTGQCPRELDVTDMLAFPLASTGEYFGVVRRLQPWSDSTLESARLHAVTQPRGTLSAWIYLVRWCQRDHCGIIHHVDGNNAYESVLIQLADTGDVIIQARATTGRDQAFRTSAVLPLRKWIRLDCSIQDSKVLLDVTWDDVTRRYQHQFPHSIHFDDTDGYFVIGGSRFLAGITGYFGPIKYYRFGTDHVENPLQPQSTLQEVDRTHQECQEIKELTRAFLQEASESLPPISRGVCTPHFLRLAAQFGDRSCAQTWSWEKQLKHRRLFQFLQSKVDKNETEYLDMKDLRSSLFEQDVGTMFTVNQNKMTLNSTTLLQASSCLGNHQASLLLATLHLSGLGRSLDHQQGHVYSLIGAMGDNHLALMHAGYKHTQGIDGFPKDLDMAYSYYSNAAAHSIIDSSVAQEEKYTPEHIYLNNEEDVYSYTHDTTDVFHFLKYQAERGDVESQIRLGSMLYWGQRGVSRDMESAVKWFERSAKKDPSAMYDYSILLMKGRGVKRNSTRGFELLKKAAAMGSINALNGLGWYHGIILKEHRNAMQYFEQAALNGSEDGMFNLGIYHLSGENPDRPLRNETAAVSLFLKASGLGHAAASVEAAWYLSTGSLRGLSQDVERAVIMLKKVCEQDGRLGFMIREALQAYLQGFWHEAFVKYVLAAESGVGLAQSNAAHLCEELNLIYDCQWRYHNYSILNYDPHPSALLKMGDYYCSSGVPQGSSSSSLGQAMSMYGRAALAGSPQGMFNLAVLAQQGHTLPASIHHVFNVSHHEEQDSVVEKILKRCMEAEDKQSVAPCAVALCALQMGTALRRMTQNRAQLFLAYASLLSVLIIAIVSLLQSCLGQRVERRRTVTPGARSSSSGQQAVPLNGDQGGIMEGTTRSLWLTTLRGQRWMGQAADLAVILSGVCLCVFWTTLLYHLLGLQTHSTH